MTLTRKTLLFFVFLCLSLLNAPAAPAASRSELSSAQQAYLNGIFAETWNSMASLVEPQTGLPYSSTERKNIGSLNDAGLYLASLAAAQGTRLITREEALSKAGKVLDSLQKLPKWRGFPSVSFQLPDLQATPEKEFSYGIPLSDLIGGLIVCRSSFPELTEKITLLLSPMQFKDLYDESRGWLKGGYDLETQGFSVHQAWGHWYYKFFASETRLLSFYGIASGAFPLAHWQSLIRSYWKKGQYQVLVSGYEERGLISHFTTSLFLDERSMDIAKNQKDYVLAQEVYAKKIGAPVWGWSLCETPKGDYLSDGELQNEIIAPYASALASIYFPKSAYQNFRKLEELGARAPFPVQGTQYLWGFHSSLDWVTGAVSKNLYYQEQALIFLSLANAIHDGLVWKSFGSDPVVQKGLSKIKAFELPTE